MYQESQYFTVKVKECKVKRMRQIFDCRLHSHTSIGVLDCFPTPLQISEEACKEAFKTGKMTVEKGVEFPVRKGVNMRNHYFMQDGSMKILVVAKVPIHQMMEENGQQ